MIPLPATPIGQTRTPSVPERLKLFDKIIENINDLFAERWEDLRFPATQLKVNPATNRPDFDFTEIRYLFDATSTETLYMIAQMPHGWKEGSNIRPHVHWQPTTTNTNNVLWRLEYKWTNINEVDTGIWISLDVLDASTGVVGTHQIASFGEIDGTNKRVSSILTMKLSRMGNEGSDNYTADTLLKEFDIHYLIDSNGSLEEYIKE